MTGIAQHQDPHALSKFGVEHALLIIEEHPVVETPGFVSAIHLVVGEILDLAAVTGVGEQEDIACRQFLRRFPHGPLNPGGCRSLRQQDSCFEALFPGELSQVLCVLLATLRGTSQSPVPADPVIARHVDTLLLADNNGGLSTLVCRHRVTDGIQSVDTDMQ